jgi:hypothetical protein
MRRLTLASKSVHPAVGPSISTIIRIRVTNGHPSSAVRGLSTVSNIRKTITRNCISYKLLLGHIHMNVYALSMELSTQFKVKR